ALLLWKIDRAEEARATLRSAYEEAVGRGDESSIAMLLLNLSGAEFVLGDWVEARRLVEEARERSLEIARQPLIQNALLGAQAVLDAVRGEAGAARETAEQVLAVAEQTGDSGAGILMLALLGFVELSLGRAAEAERRLAEAVARAEAAGICDPRPY